MSEVRELNAEALQGFPLPGNDEETDKDARGRVLLIGGSALSPGAMLLSSMAALRGGAGKVLVATAEPIAQRLGLAAPEMGVVGIRATSAGEPDGEDESLDRYLGDCDAVLLGPGMMDADNARTFAFRLLNKIQVPLVLDAAAITAFADNFEKLRSGGMPRILTPHAGEMASLVGVSKERVRKSPIELASRASSELGSTVMLKGATTYIASPEGRLWRHSGGVCGLATAGSGDTLAGLLAALLARGASAECAAVWSVFVHAEAGRALSESIGPVGFLAGELAASFPGILQRISSGH